MSGLLNSPTLDPLSSDGALSADWSDRPLIASDTVAGSPAISGGMAVSPAMDTDWHEAWWNAESFSGVHEVWATMAQDGREYWRLWLCLADPGVNGQTDGYYLERDYSSGTDSLSVVRVDNDSETQLGDPISQELEVGDGMALVRKDEDTLAVGYCPSGGEWTEIATRADSTYTSGYVGFGIRWDSSTSPGIGPFGAGYAIVPTVMVYTGSEWVEREIRRLQGLDEIISDLDPATYYPLTS